MLRRAGIQGTPRTGGAPPISFDDTALLVVIRTALQVHVVFPAYSGFSRLP